MFFVRETLYINLYIQTGNKTQKTEQSQTRNLLPFSVYLFRSCDLVYHKQKVRIRLYLLTYCHLTIITLIHWIKIDHALL